VCLRKVFSHEVRNILQFKSHKGVASDGKARYILPPEGQPTNLPRYLGGKPTDDPEHGRKSPDDTKYWDEGWYLWKTNSFLGVYNTIAQMPNNLDVQDQQEAAKRAKRKLRKEYEEFRKSGQTPTQDNKWLGPIIPPNLGPDPSSDSLLIPLPLDTGPLLEPILNLLSPTRHSIQLLNDNWTEGNFQKFGLRMWERTLTGDPLTLASRACGFAYEQWKNKGKADEDDKEET